MKPINLPVITPSGAQRGPNAVQAAQTAGAQATTDGMRVYVETYGCQMNVADTELIEGILQGAGYRTVGEPGEADIILVNTCAVREHAEERVFGRLGELTRYKHRNPSLVLGVAGCMAEHLREAIPARASAVDLVVGPDAYRRLPELIAAHVREEHPADPTLDVRLDRQENYLGINPVRGESATGWVTIMRGCDRFCTFCVVPYTRGREKSVPPDEILRQVRGLAENSYREVCLLGQTVNSYRHGETDFADLLRRVSAVDGIERVRFTSPHPADFTPKLVATMGEVPEICPYVHLPVQSGSDAILARMRRDYTIEHYLRIVEDLRRAIPECALSTDIIVGFSGETEEDYERTYRLMEEVRFDFAFMFKYSAREGTAAARSLPDDVPEEEKGRRLQAIIRLQERISAERFGACVGQVVEVLVEGPAKKSPGHIFGRTRDFKGVIAPGSWLRNTLLRVRITGSSPHTLFGVA